MPMLDVEGGSIYYQVKGTGIPIIFIHPPLLTSANFIYQIEDLSRNYQVITFDMRGHGRSSYSTRAITYELIVEDISRLLKHLHIEKAFICGYSTGGTIALEFLLTMSNMAYGGIVISGMSEVSDFILKNRILMAVKLAKTKSLSLLATTIAWGNSNSRGTFKKLYDEAIKGDARNIRQYYRYSFQYNCTSQLHEIDLPVLLVYGKKNKGFYKYARILHEGLPNNKWVLLQKEKHQLPTKAAMKLNECIQQFIRLCKGQ